MSDVDSDAETIVVKIESASPDQKSVETETVDPGKVRRLSAQFEGKSRRTRTPSPSKMTADNARQQLDLKLKTVDVESQELKAALAVVPPDLLTIEIALNFLQSQVDAEAKLRQGLVTALLKDKKSDECAIEETLQRTRTKDFMRLEIQANAILNPPQKDNDNHSDAIRALRYNRKDLPKLTGCVKDWLPFWALFQDVHSDKTLSDVHKLQLLIQSTKEGTEAREIVNSYTVAGTNYKGVLEHLKNLYGRENVLIKVYVRELLQLAIDKSTGKQIEFRKMVTAIIAQCQNLTMLGVTDEKCDQILYPIIEACVPKDLLATWQHHADYTDEVSKLIAFLQKEVNNETERDLAHFSFENNEKPSGGGRTQKKGKAEADTPTAAVLHNKPAEVCCVFCNKNHSSYKCFAAGRMDMNSRKEILKKAGACFTCLERSHMSRSCPNKGSIKCSVCGRQHYNILCTKTSNSATGGSESERKPADQSEQCHASTSSVTQPVPTTSSSTLKNVVNAPEIPLQIIPIVVEGTNGMKMKVRALFDTGSQKSYILKKIHGELQFQKVRDETVSHLLFGGSSTKEQHHEVVKVNAVGIKTEFPCNFDVSCIDKITEKITQPTGGSWIFEFQQRGVIFPESSGSSTVEILIGNDVAPRLYTGRIVDLGYGPAAMETKWGWVLCGKLPPPIENKSCTVNKVHVTLNMFNLPINQLWDLEVLGITDAAHQQTKEDLAVMTQQHFERKVKRLHDGRYEVEMPFLEGAEQLIPTNYAGADRRLMSVTKKLRDDNFYEHYEKVFCEWEELGIIEEVPFVSDTGHFLPHHPVYKLNSETTPIRPVFDASAKPRGRPSLNECLDAGLSNLEKIPALLTRFRQKPVALTADVKKAFQQISIHKEHRKYLRFLWWKKSSKEKKLYQHCRVVFGINCSPFLLGAVLNYHLDSSPPTHVGTAEILKKSLYVDNVVVSVSNIQEAHHIRDQSRELLCPAQFDLRGWEFGPSDGGRKIHILGLIWDSEKDTFAIDLTAFVEKKFDVVTQRVVLATVHMLFDPVGFIAPFVIAGKQILRKCHSERLGWDTPLPTPIVEEFMKWKNQVPVLADMRIPRYVHWDEGDNCSLHVFSDASCGAYAACVFLRKKKNDRVIVSLVISKTRISPMKKMTIPRLELMGCLIGARLAHVAKQDLGKEEITTTHWTDSSTSKAWIDGAGPWGIFVDNRVKEVRALTKGAVWKHVPGKLNPADLPSRGCSASKLLQLQWFKGPDWLYNPPEQWPDTVGEISEEEVASERKKTIAINLTYRSNSPVESFLRISEYPRILRAVSNWINMKKIMLNRIRKVENVPVSTEEKTRTAETVIIKHVQSQLEMNLLRLKKLRPFKDEDGIFRTTTKLFHEDDVAIQPIILPDDNEFVKRIIRHEHENMCHAGTNLVLAKIRERFWLLNGRRAVRKITNSCWTCRRYITNRIEVPEAPLPSTRTGTGVPFSTIGVDVAGPLILKKGPKVWMVLFTCAAYRAIHLEVVDSMSTDEFLLAFRRFAARRGKPAVVHSDNGLNFVGANAALQKIYKNNIVEFSRLKRIDWRFNAPLASWWGGLYERLIGLVKQLVRRMLGKRAVHRKELDVLLLEVEEHLNNRPLTYLPETPDDPVPLTPNMMVRDSGLSFLPEVDLRDASGLRGTYRRVQRIREALKTRFRKEYLGQLSFRRKFRSGGYALKPGDVVLVENDNEKRQAWHLGVIYEGIPGIDGVHRTFWVRTKGGMLKRPAQRLFPMEIQ